MNQNLEKIFENSVKRAAELNLLLDDGNNVSSNMIRLIENEVVRIREELDSFIMMCEQVPLSKAHIFDKGNGFSQIIYDIEQKLSIYRALNREDTVNSTLYPVLLKDMSNAEKIEVFAGFMPLHPEDDLPRFSYGIKFLLKDGKEQIHIFESSGDGCFMSDHANDRRKRSLNVVIALAEDILHKVHDDHHIQNNIEKCISMDMKIEGVFYPDGWTVMNGPDSKGLVYRSKSIFPPSYFESKIFSIMWSMVRSGSGGIVRLYSSNIASEDYKKSFRVTREFGVKFIVKDQIVSSLILDEAGEGNLALYTRVMNKVITLIDQIYYESLEMHPLLKMQIEVDIDRSGLLCPDNYVFLDPKTLKPV